MILVCNICGASHYTQNCPEFAKGDHVKDKPSLNLSRSSVPNGLLIMDTQQGSCVVTSQKFAKGTRFGPLLAQRSYVPIKNIPFPLVLFAGPYYHHQDEYSQELQTLFGSSRNVYLDTRNESKCNWMIHVNLARFSNEQNLICYQENDEIYYTAVKDIELGDILRVWYSRNYANKIGASLLEPSPYEICNNILRSVSLDYGFDLEKGHSGFAMEEYSNPAPVTVGNSGSSSGTVGSSHTNSSNTSSSGNCGTSNVNVENVFKDQQDHLSCVDTSGNTAGGDLVEIDSNNNSSNFCSAVAGGVKNGTLGSAAGSTTLATYDKVSLPPIDSLMKTSSPKYASASSQQHLYDIDLLGTADHLAGTPVHQNHHSTTVSDLMDDYFNTSALVYSSHFEPSHQQDHSTPPDQYQAFQHSVPEQYGTLQHHQHVGLISSPQAEELSPLPRSSYPSDHGHAGHESSHPPSHHHHVHQQTAIAAPSALTDYQCLPDDTLSPADLINISLGASDINITFDSAYNDGGGITDLVGNGGGMNVGGALPHLLAYEGTNDGVDGDFGDGMGFDLMATTSSTGSGVGGGGSVVGLEKLHSQFSSSSDSLITLNDANLGISAVTPTPSVVSSAALCGTETDVDKKYVCEVCLRKYMTKSNLDKHVRKHNLFLCVFCMKLFQQADELKEHECSERKSKTAYLHCPKCLKVLSNSWSLQRHMKIHKDLTPEDVTPGGGGGSAVEMGKLGAIGEATTMAGKETAQYEDLSNTTPMEDVKPSIEMLNGTTSTIAAVTILGREAPLDMHDKQLSSQREKRLLTETEIKKEFPTPKVSSSPNSPAAGTSSGSSLPNLSSIQITNTSSSQDMLTNVQAPNGKQLYKCIVCSKLFKNPNALEKHLRKVHTVYTVSNDYKSEKKVLSQLNQKKTSPIKPAIAKALATKLSQKSKKQEELAAAAAAAAALAAANGEQRVEENQPTSSVNAAPHNQPARGTGHGGAPLAGSEHGPAQSRSYAKKKNVSGSTAASGLNNGAFVMPGTDGKQNHNMIAGPNTLANPRTNSDAQLVHSSKDTSGGSRNALANGGSSSGTPGKSHSIIIISNVELSNNNLIDTSQLFLNQGSSVHHGNVAGSSGANALGNKIDVKVLNSNDMLPKLVPISNHHRHHQQQQQQQQQQQLPQQLSGPPGGSTATLQLSGTAIVVPSTAVASGMHDSVGYPITTTSLVRSKADDGSTLCEILGDRDAFAGASRDTGVNTPSPSSLVISESLPLTLSPMKLTETNCSGVEATSVIEDVCMEQEKRHSTDMIASTVSNDDLSNDNDRATPNDEFNLAQLSQTFPCDECDRVFTKNYQLKRHMEIHDSVYYTCPYCDRLPLKAKASLRKHLYNTHPERAPPKEQMNKFISTLVVTDENVLRELAIKNERKIRNKSAKLQAKLVHQQQQQLKHQPQQQHRQMMASIDDNSPPCETIAAPSPSNTNSGIILYENGISDPMLSEQGEDMLSFKTIFPVEEGSIDESSLDRMDHMTLESCDQSSTCSSNTTTHASTSAAVEDKKRKSGSDHRDQHLLQQEMKNKHTSTAGCAYGKASGGVLDDGVIVADGKRMKILNASTSGASGSGMNHLSSTVTSGTPPLDICGSDHARENALATNRYTSANADAAPSSIGGTGTTLRYLRKNQLAQGGSVVTPTATSNNSIDITNPGVSSSMLLIPNNCHQQQLHHSQHHHHHHGGGTSSALDGGGQLNLDSLFGNISIDNYEFDDNATIQSFSLIEEKFKTSFDQIQEKLDAELPFDEEQIKWQNNIMANDSSSEIGDKLLTGEENIMLI